MGRSATLAYLVVLAGCAKKDVPQAVDSTVATPPPAPLISLVEVAGKWDVITKNEAADSVLNAYVLTATSDKNGWTITFPGRPPIPLVLVAVEGDSIVTEAGPFESVLRPGVQVTTRGVMRLQHGMLMGTTVAHYQTTGADSVRRIRIEGRRQP